jgi:glycosyltransferase involved in cell wall biosynthesis
MSGTRARTVSVVIPTRNRAALMACAVQSVWGQTIPAFEIHVVDNCSTDETQDRIPELQQQSPIPLYYHRMQVDGGPAASRNFGAAQARGEYVLFLDSDVELDPRWIEEALMAFASEDAPGMVTGKVVFAKDKSILHCVGGDMNAIGVAWDGCQGEDERN